MFSLSRVFFPWFNLSSHPSLVCSFGVLVQNSWTCVLYFFRLPTLSKYFYKHNYELLILNSLQTSKNEEEEFNTGPLSVLMMSVKNNTQVCICLCCVRLTVPLCKSRHNCSSENDVKMF